MTESLDIVFIGLSITSSWGNGHATTYRSLLRELNEQGHNCTFLEKDVPWYAPHRDLPKPPFCEVKLYQSNAELFEKYKDLVKTADVVVVGSYVQQGVEVGNWAVDTAQNLCAFYDIDTPVTLQKLAEEDHEYLSPELISRYNMYLSFTGGPTLTKLEEKYGSPMAKALYCSVDPELYYPQEDAKIFDLGYLGTYSDDRQPPLEELMLKTARLWPAGRFVVAGPQYPESVNWLGNVERIDHLPPEKHRAFYNQQRCTLNITRAAMKKAGYAPSVRLFEAAACGVPIISDYWPGLETIFEPGREILISRSADESLEILHDMPSEQLQEIGAAARQQVMLHHTAAQRARQFSDYCRDYFTKKKGLHEHSA